MKLQILLVPLLLSLLACSPADQASTPSTASQTPPANLLVEGNAAPLNVHNATPRLSWHANVVAQQAYQVQVASSEPLLAGDTPDLWDSQKIVDERSVNMPYQGKALKANQEVVWRVRVWSDDSEQPGPWSPVGKWEMGLIEKSDWQAKWLQVKDRVVAENNANHMEWILYAANVHPESFFPLKPAQRTKQLGVVEQLKDQETASLFRHDFSIPADKQVVKAKLHSTAAGYYEIFLNGEKVDDRIMDPGQTDFDKRILYNTDEVSAMVASGDNTIAVHLGSGWYDENVAFSRWLNPDEKKKNPVQKTLSFGQPKFIAQLELTFADGSTQVVTSNEQWLSHPSPVLKEGLFSGELYDANQVVANWNTQAGAAELENWQPVEALAEWPTKVLEPQLLPPIRAIKKMLPQKIYQPRENVWVLDFGQNFTAVPTFNLTKLGLKPGQTISMRYAEWADVDGNISQKSGGGAPLLKQVDSYVASGSDEQTWTPAFTWHGFQYVEITGLAEQPPLDAMEAYLVRSDVEVVGQFESSNALVNRIHDMALWTYESNLMAVPMDCPIRERAGWTGDAHAAQITGNYNYDMGTFWPKYLGDFQTSAHIAPAVVPGKRSHGGTYDWAAAEVMIAWEHYRHHGDLQVIRDQYESMAEYMQAGEAQIDNGLIRIGYGDWCDPVPKPGMTRKRCNPEYTSHIITTSVLYAHSANLMSKMATLLGKPDDAKHYAGLFKSVGAQFHKEFYNAETGHYGSQTADAMAIMFDLAPTELRESIAAALNKDVVETWKGHGSIGALGQTYVYRALSDFGYGDAAFGIFTAEGYPGYTWQFEELKANSLWERKGVWDPAQDPMRKNPHGRSLSHPFHSGYDGWFYEGLGGIRPLGDNPGFQHFELSPVFPAALESAQVSYKTGYGKIVSNWQRTGDTVEWQFEIPNNSTAKVTLPNTPAKVYGPGSYTLTVAKH